MRIASQLVHLLSLPLGGDIEIPELVQPTMEGQLPFQAGKYGVSVDMRGRTCSAIAWNVLYRTGVSAGGEATLFTFDKGSYEIDIHTVCYANYVETIANFPQMSVFVESPDAGAGEIASFGAYTGAPRFKDWKNKFTFNQVGYTLKMSDGATVLGNERSFYVRAYVRQLL